MAERTPLTVDEHKALGAELHAINHRLVHISGALANRVGKSSKVGRHAAQLGDALTKARSDLDDLMARDYPDEFSPRVYYPGGEPSDVRWDHAGKPVQ